jgi:hypothetical protein
VGKSQLERRGKFGLRGFFTSRLFQFQLSGPGNPCFLAKFLGALMPVPVVACIYWTWYVYTGSGLARPLWAGLDHPSALYRASQPLLGSIVLAALLLTLTRMLLLCTVFLRRVPVYLPIPLRMYTGPLLFAAGYLEDVAGSLSKYALVYVGLTGEGPRSWCGEGFRMDKEIFQIGACVPRICLHGILGSDHFV